MPAPDDQNANPAPRGLIRFVRPLVFTLAVFFLILVGLWIALPRLTQELLVPMLASALGMPHMSVDIRRADFSGLDLGEISLAPDSDIRTTAVQVDWSLDGLLRGRVDRVRIMGLHVLARETDGKWAVRGLPEAKKSPDASSAPMFMPRIGEVFLDGQIILDGHHLKLSAPLSVNGSLDEDGRLLLDTRTALAGQDVRLALDADLGRNDFRLALALPPASIAALASLIPGLGNLPVSGTIEAQANATLPSDQKPRMEAGLGLGDIRTLIGDNALAQEGDTTMRLDWQDGARLALDPIRLSAPLPLVLTMSDMQADLDSGTFGGSFDLAVATLPGLRFSSTPHLTGRTEIKRTDLGWDMRTRAELGSIDISLVETPELKATLEPTPVSLDISTNGTDLRMAGGLALGRLRLTRETATVSMSGLNMNCTATRLSGAVTGTARLDGARLEARTPALTLTANALGAECAFKLGDEPSLNGTLSAKANAKSGDTAAVMTMRLPLAWPHPAASPGSMNVDVNWKKKDLAKISSRIVQKVHGLSLDGSVSVLPVELRASLKGHVDMLKPEASWVEVNAAQELILPGNLARFAPTLSELSGSVRLVANARLDLSRGAPMVPASMKLTGLTLAHGQSKTTLNNGSAALAFSDLLTFRSDPAGRMAFDRLQLGAVILEQGDIRFQIEALHSILVEGCGFRWAGGRVGSQAFRVNPNVEDYTVELYCDQVVLAQALGQLGMTQAKGDGTVNGRIPLHYADGSLTFDNGFLYSTPGEKGVLRVQGTEILTAGVPQGSAQYGQLDLAAEALKDFSYEWAKIRVNTQQKELIVSLQLDGKPEKPLPFTFNRDIGGFARVSADSPGSVFQGIRLDVNFRLPLDQLLQYRQLIELMKNGG